MSALLASSCSRNGISAAATETTCLGETSIRSTFSGDEIVNSLLNLHDIKSPWIFPLESRCVFACAIVYLLSSIAESHLISSLTLFLVTTLYGVSKKP